jgi:hypothetical protein
VRPPLSRRGALSHHRLPPICIKHPSILQVLGGRPIGAPRVGVSSEADSYLALAGQTIKEIAVEGTTGIVSGGVAGIVVSDCGCPIDYPTKPFEFTTSETASKKMIDLDKKLINLLVKGFKISDEALRSVHMGLVMGSSKAVLLDP